MRIVALLMTALLALSPVALASDSFTDPSGDSGGDPDITSVTLSHTDTTVTIAVEFGSVPPLGFSESDGYTDMLLVGIHTDEDLSRRDVEFWTGVHAVDVTSAMVVRGGSERGSLGPPMCRSLARPWRSTSSATCSVTPTRIGIQVAAGRESVSESAAVGRGDEARTPGPHAYMLGDGGRSFWMAGGRGCCGDARRPRARPGSAFWAAASQQGAPLRGIGCSERVATQRVVGSSPIIRS